MKQTVYIASPESQQIHVWNLNHEIGAKSPSKRASWPRRAGPSRGVSTLGCSPVVAISSPFTSSVHRLNGGARLPRRTPSTLRRQS